MQSSFSESIIKNGEGAAAFEMAYPCHQHYPRGCAGRLLELLIDVHMVTGTDSRARGRGFKSFQVLLACQPVLVLIFALASRDMLRSHMTLALPLEFYQRPHDHGLTNSFQTEVKLLPCYSIYVPEVTTFRPVMQYVLVCSCGKQYVLVQSRPNAFVTEPGAYLGFILGTCAAGVLKHLALLKAYDQLLQPLQKDGDKCVHCDK